MNTLGNKLKVTIFGQSHGHSIGCVVDGLPAGFRPDMDQLAAFMARRAPGRSSLSTQRKETDTPEILSGLVDGTLCGAPLCAVIRNSDHNSTDYAALKDIPRPSHADFTARMKYGENCDLRGGGAFSGRLTAPLCLAGGIALQILEQRGIRIGAHIAQIGRIHDRTPDFAAIDIAALNRLTEKALSVFDNTAILAMTQRIENAAQDGDSVGGMIRCFVLGLPSGIGEPMFSGVESRLATALFGIPAVRGVSFGEGFDAAAMRGSEHNDPFAVENGRIITRTNHAGGVLGGITTAMPLVVNVAFKPTPSIAQEQESVNLATMERTTLRIQGRHDPCIVPRAVPVVEAVTALTVLDMLMEDTTWS